MEASSQRTRSLHSFMHPSAVGLCDKVLPLLLFQTGGRQQVNVRASLPDYILSAFLIFAGSSPLLLDGFLNHVRRHSSSHCPLKQSLSSSTGRLASCFFHWSRTSVLPAALNQTLAAVCKNFRTPLKITENEVVEGDEQNATSTLLSNAVGCRYAIMLSLARANHWRKTISFIPKFSNGLNYLWRTSSLLSIGAQTQQSYLLASKVIGGVFNQTKKRIIHFSQHIRMFLSYFTVSTPTPPAKRKNMRTPITQAKGVFTGSPTFEKHAVYS